MKAWGLLVMIIGMAGILCLEGWWAGGHHEAWGLPSLAVALLVYCIGCGMVLFG